MRKGIFLIFIFVIFIFACSSEKESENSDFGVKGLTPYFNKINEENNEVQIDIRADLTDQTFMQELFQNWTVEKISLENYDFSLAFLDKKAESINEKSNNNDFIYENKNNESDKISAIFYKPGYYKVTYSITDLIETQKKELILKIGEVDIPELYFMLNIPNEEKDLSNDYIGNFEILAGNIDVTADYIDVKLSDIKTNWFNSKIKIDTTKQFVINSGVSSTVKNKKNEILSTDFVAFSDFIQIKGKDSFAYLNNEEIDITDSPVEVSIKKQLFEEDVFYYTKNQFYFSNLNFFEENEGKQLFESSYGILELGKMPYKFGITAGNVISSSLFIGTSGIHFKKSNYTVCFSTEGIISDVVDSDGKRPYPTYPYGYLFGRLGKSGRVFPVGKYFLSDLRKLDNFYVYNMENKVLEKQD